MMGLMSFLCVRAAQLGRIFMREVDDFAGERFGVGIGARTGAGQADIDGVNAERFHQVEDFDFFADAGIVDGGILEAVAKGFVVEHHAAAGGDFGVGEGVPVVDEFVFHFVGAVVVSNTFLCVRRFRDLIANGTALIAQRVAVRRLR